MLVDRLPAQGAETHPDGSFGALGEVGLLGLPYPEDFGGGGQPYEVYLRLLEELTARWAARAVANGVNGRVRYTAAVAGGDTHGQERSPRIGVGCRGAGATAAITLGGIADFYALFAHIDQGGGRGISCSVAPDSIDGVSRGRPRKQMSLHVIPTTTAHWDGVVVGTYRLVRVEGRRLEIAFSALDPGRLGIAACATGLGRAVLDLLLGYPNERAAVDERSAGHQGATFRPADMGAAVDAVRETYLAAARRRDNGLPYSREARTAKLVATDAAMEIVTYAAHVLGGNRSTGDLPGQWGRDVKIIQILQGTNRIQRLVIGRDRVRAVR